MVQRSTIVLCLFLLSILNIWSQQNDCVRNDCFATRNFDSIDTIEVEHKGIYQHEIDVFVNPIVMDIDNDCVPELIMPGKALGNNLFLSNSILVFDTKSRSLIHEIPTYYFRVFHNCFTVLKTTDSYEVIILHPEYALVPISIRNRLVCYRSDGSIKWVSDYRLGNEYNRDHIRNISMADFNMDGVPEIYVSNVIFNAQTGVRLADGGKNGLGGVNLVNSTIAANLDDDPTDLELAAGYTIYKVTITNINGMDGNEMIPYNIEVEGKKIDGMTVVADINRDGKLDVIVGGAFEKFNRGQTLYVYTLTGNQCELLAQINYDNINEFGIPAIGNVSNTDELGIVFFSTDNNFVIKLSYNNSIKLSEDWRIKISDAWTFNGVSLFDFDNDGIHEIVYRDVKELVILNAKNDNVYKIYSTPCSSGTASEYPVIADLTNEGITNICLSCGKSSIDYDYGFINIFGPPDSTRWAPARNIWHQYNYNPLFINDDGTVPQHMHNPATYKNGKYNNFNAQEIMLDIPAASLYGDITCIGYDVDTDSYHVSFTVRNRADASATARTNVPVAFYTGDPEQDGRLIGVYHTTASITAGDGTGTLSYSFPASGVTSLWMVVNTDRYPMIPGDSSFYNIDECDYTDNVFIAELPKIQRQQQEICEGDTVDFYGQQLSTAGQYHYKLRSATDCDSLIAILDLTVTDKKDEAVTDKACDTYNWNGQTYDSSGDYEYRTQSISGCDSIVTLSLSIHSSIQQTEAQTTCESYDWNGQTYTTSGIFTYNGQTSQGCDSTVTLNLTIHPKATTTQQISVCDSYEWNGQKYDQSGTYTYKGQTKYGCDSTAILELVVSTSLTVTEEKTACDQIIINGISLDTSGDYPESYLTSTGCDSTHILRLTIHKSTESNQAITACSQYDFFGSRITESGIYRHTLTNQQGCDSLITLDLRIAAEASQATASACGSYHWAVGDTTITNSGVYTARYLNQYGCDSTITLTLNIAPEYDIQKQEEACGNFTWSVTKERYTATGIYSQLLKTAQGCDSLLTLDLTIHPEFEFHDTVSTTTPYYWPLNGQTYDQSGVYTEFFRSEASCDSLHVLHLRVNYNTDIYFPNVITGEGRNGFFTGYSTGEGVQIKTLSVFDRWGNRVFHKEHFAANEPEAGWNGKLNGRNVVQGVYVWTAQIVHRDGSEETFSGDVTVVR